MSSRNISFNYECIRYRIIIINYCLLIFFFFVGAGGGGWGVWGGGVVLIRWPTYFTSSFLFLSFLFSLQMKNSGSFHISALNIDCGYLLEPPRRGGSKSTHNLRFCAEIRKLIYIPVNPS